MRAREYRNSRPSETWDAQLLLKCGHTTFLLLLLPALELVFLRLFLKFYLKLKIGFSLTTDFDYFFSVPAAVFLFIFSCAQGGELNFCLQKSLLKINALSFVLFLFLNCFIKYAESAGFPSLLWGTLLTVIIFSSFCVFVPVKYFLANPNRLAFFPSLILAFLFPIYMNLPEKLWEVFGAFTSRVTQGVFQLLSFDSTTVMFTKHRILAIKHPLQNILIGKGCGGMDGSFLFVLTFGVFVSLYRKYFSFWSGLAFFLLGILLMFAANILRIILLFWSGIFLRQVFGYEQGGVLFRVLAHTHVGWILYALVLGIYFSLLFFSLVETKTVSFQLGLKNV